MITINGKTFFGNSVIITDNRIIIDGKEDLDVKSIPEKEINIHIDGDINEVKADYCSKITVNGNVKKVQTTSGDIEVKGDVTGGVQTTSGDVDIDGNVDGDIHSVSGDVDCGDVSGEISTMSGDIRRRTRRI